MSTQQPKDLTGADIIALEKLVDAYGLDGVLVALGTVAWLKADHVRAIWHHESLAVGWSEASRQLRRLSESRAIRDTAIHGREYPVTTSK